MPLGLTSLRTGCLPWEASQVVPVLERIGADWIIPFAITDSGVASISVDHPELFATAVSVDIAPPANGVQATATTAVVGGGLVVTITDPGVGYDRLLPPPVTLSGGTSAKATAVVGNPIDGTGSTLAATLYDGTAGMVALAADSGSVSWTNQVGGIGQVHVTPVGNANIPPYSLAACGTGRFPVSVSVEFTDSAGSVHILDPIAVLPLRPQDYAFVAVQTPLQVLTVAGTQGPAGITVTQAQIQSWIDTGIVSGIAAAMTTGQLNALLVMGIL